MTDTKDNLDQPKPVTFKILPTQLDWVKDRQQAIRRATGVQPTYTEIFQSMIEALEACLKKDVTESRILLAPGADSNTNYVGSQLNLIHNELKEIRLDIRRAFEYGEPGGTGETASQILERVHERLDELAGVQKKPARGRTKTGKGNATGVR